MAAKVKVGVIGCGYIFQAYMKGCGVFDILDIVACADIDMSRARARAAEFNIPRACTVEELLADPEIQIVINLTVPLAHAEVNLAIIEAGKHVYSEKPLAVSREDGAKIISAARTRGVMVGCAPDTFLGGGLQTCRKLIDDGWIGRPIAATAFLATHGPESWHPNVYFYYQQGGGPVLDMAPYYLTALISLLGPVRRIAASTGMSFPERIATSKELYGKRIPVEVSTHASAVLDFVSGPIVTMIMSFDVWGHHLPRLEVHGTDGSLSCPDPNVFGGPVSLLRAGSKEWDTMALSHTVEVQRGIGPADMAYALCYGRPHRATGEMAYHVLDIMHAFDESSKTGRHVELTSTCARPAALPMGLLYGTLDGAA